MLIGYARVSTDDQNLDLQRDALTRAGCARIFEEKESGRAGTRRGALEAALAFLRPEDQLVVWKVDRLGRSLREMLDTAHKLQQQNVRLRSLTEAIDTTTAAGRMMMQMVGSFAEFERAMIRERTSAGLAQARAEGRIGGRRPKLGDKQRREIAESVTSGRKSGAEMARLYGVSEPTVSRIVAAHRQQFSQQQREQA